MFNLVRRESSAFVFQPMFGTHFSPLILAEGLQRLGEDAWIELIQKLDEVCNVLLQYEVVLEKSQQFVFSVLASMSDILVGCGRDGRFVRLMEDLPPLIEGTVEGAERTRDSVDSSEVCFRDNGPGFPEEDLAHLFEPFFTTKVVGKGTGLGLAISCGIIERHGGSLAANNSPDGGAVFTLRFPLVRP